MREVRKRQERMNQGWVLGRKVQSRREQMYCASLDHDQSRNGMKISNPRHMNGKRFTTQSTLKMNKKQKRHSAVGKRKIATPGSSARWS